MTWLATSMAVERVFSQGRHLLHFTRNHLSGHSIRVLLCLGSWSHHDMIRDEDILAAIKGNMNKNGKGKRKIDVADEGEEVSEV